MSSSDDDTNVEHEDMMKRLPALMKLLRVGDQLFASCSQEVFGTIAGINPDNTVDIMVNNFQDLIALETGYLIVPEWMTNVSDTKVLIREIEIDWIGDFDDEDGLRVSFKTVDGCGGCVRRFIIERDGVAINGKAAVLA
jgi:hypothetical protein